MYLNNHLITLSRGQARWMKRQNRYRWVGGYLSTSLDHFNNSRLPSLKTTSRKKMTRILRFQMLIKIYSFLAAFLVRMKKAIQILALTRTSRTLAMMKTTIWSTNQAITTILLLILIIILIIKKVSCKELIRKSHLKRVNNRKSNKKLKNNQ